MNQEGWMTEVSHRAMATDFVVLLPVHHSGAVEVAVESLELLDSIEASLTVYRSDSEISRLNQAAGGDWVTLTAETFALLERSVRWSQWTEGALDVTAGPLVEAWGFQERVGRKPTPEEIQDALARVGYQAIELDRDSRRARLARPNMSINLGAIGKGDALDRIAQSMLGSGVDSFLIHGGNSSVLARGDQTTGTGLGWAVGLAHPTKPRRRIGGVWLKDNALATSGSGKQFFHHQGKRYGHVIDPRTGFPAGDLTSLTAIMPSAADADGVATGMFVAGSKWISDRVGQEKCQNVTPVIANNPIPDVIMIRPGSRQDSVDIETHGEIRWVDAPDSLKCVSRKA